MNTVDHSEKGKQHEHTARVSMLLLGLVTLIVLFPINNRATAYLSTRSVSVSTSLPSASAIHDFRFDALGSPSIGSVVFEYCGNSPLVEVACTAPMGFNSSAANLTFQSGDLGYTIHPNTGLTSNRVILTRIPAPSALGTKEYQLSNLTNPSTANATTYVRIFTYASDDGTGPFDDTGSVAFTTQDALTVSVYVPPYLALCTGVTVAVDCTTTIGDVVDMGELSKTSSNGATTQFSVATNSFNGYNALLVGSTMTAGNRTIPALSVPTTSQPGTSQFGINLRDNASPNVGNNVDGSGTGTPAPNYNTPNVFRFQSGDTIASSPLSTEWNRYTISYLVNVSDSQPAGRYASTLTVIATTTF